MHEKFAELWATHEVNLATLATCSEAMVSRESVETLFLPTESSDGYGNSQVSIASIVKWMAFGDSTIMARLLQQRQETQLQQDVSRALTITPQTRFSSLYSLACALESDRLVLDTPEAMILLATLKLTRACSVTAREFACEVVKLESTAPQQAWTDALSSSLDNIVGQGAVLFEVMLASPYSGNGSGTSIMVPWEPLLVATGWIRDSLTEIEATLQSANPVNADKKVASGTLLRFKQVFRLMEEAIQRFWGLPLPSLGAHLWEVGGHPAVPINTEGWELLNRLRRMVIPPWKGAYIATPSIEESLNTVTVEMFTSALPSCAEATTPFGIPALMRQNFSRAYLLLLRESGLLSIQHSFGLVHQRLILASKQGTCIVRKSSGFCNLGRCAI